MMLFDARAALAEIEKQPLPPATSATTATQKAKSTPFVAKVAGVATSQAQIPKTEDQTTSSNVAVEDDCRHGFAINGYPKTWTGNIVSLDAWRQLSEWDKHGPNGRMWNGITKRWERQE